MLLWAFVGFPLSLGSIQTLCIDLLTELMPAISLVNESAESDIMMVPPRNPAKDKLVTLPLMFYSYFQSGIIETGCCYFVFFMVRLNTFLLLKIDLFVVYRCSITMEYLPATSEQSITSTSPLQTILRTHLMQAMYSLLKTRNIF